jgi:hypothetical protein
MSERKVSYLRLPVVFARYIAMSALRSMALGLLPSETATPMLA